MITLKKSWILLLVLALALSLAFGCAPAEEPEEPEEPEPVEEPEEEEEEEEEEEVVEDVQEIKLAITRDPETLDPAHLTWTSAHGVTNNIFNGLVRWETGTFEIVPDLAYDWDISEDGKVYTFYLEEGVQWHGDYGEFTADDVKFTFERILDEETASRWKSLVAEVEEIVVVDDYTVEIHSEVASPVLLHHLSAYRPGKILSRAAYEDLGEDYAFEPIGTGPFMFERWTPHEEVVLVGNPDYWEGAPSLEKVTFQIISEDTVAAMAMSAGELDSMLVSLEEVYEGFEADPNITMEELASTATRYYNLRTVQAPFDDVRVRRAMAHATDREGVAEVVGMGTLPLYAMIPKHMFGYSEDAPRHEFDLDVAMELLEEAGYPDGFETEYYGRDIEIEQDVFAYQQSLYRDIGVDVAMNTMDSSAWVEATTRGESPMAWLSLSARHDPDGILSGFYHGSVSSPDGRNFTWYGGADDLIDAARVEMDEAKREELYFQVQEKFYEDVPTIPLFQPTTIRANQPWVKGFQVGQVEDTYLYPVRIEGRGR